MKIVVAALLSFVAVVSGGACRPCEKITAWKLYTSGSPPDWPINNSITMQETPGFFTRINNGTCVRSNRVDAGNWNIMMFTDPVYKDDNCCGDTDEAVNDFISLCAQFRLYAVNATGEYQIKKSFAELYWPWFLYGDTQCDPLSFSENADTFDVANGDCNPSNDIFDSHKVLPVGKYKLKGCTYSSCPDRPSGQGGTPTGELDCSEVTFEVKARC